MSCRDSENTTQGQKRALNGAPDSVSFGEGGHPIGERFRTSSVQKLSCLFPFVLGLSVIISLVACTATQAAPPNAPIPAAKIDAPLAAAPGKQTAVFGGGCFWGTQSVLERVKGVVKTTAGYSGGAAKTATYDQVSSETTGHAESVEVVYDPSRITYGQLLRIFFSVVHDPTQLNRQGPDVGASYRSVIFYSDDEQKQIATAYIAQLDAAKVFPKPIVTQVTPLKGFYRAEDYHQDYALHHEDNPIHPGMRRAEDQGVEAAVSGAVCRVPGQVTGCAAGGGVVQMCQGYRRRPVLWPPPPKKHIRPKR